MTKRVEGGAKFLAEQFRLFPGREVTAFVELVVVDQIGISPLRPTPWSLVQLVREDAHGNRDGDAFDSEERNLALECLPIEARAGNRGVRQPGKRDVVEDVILRKALGLPMRAASFF
jgi:hypothetical protein